MEDLTNTFVEAALSNRARAEEILSRNPGPALAGFHSALVWGDVRTVTHAIQQDPSVINAKGGPKQWEPVLYVCFSRFADVASTRAKQLVDTADVLLSHGANPNTFYIDPHWPDWPLPCLYGATGLNNNPALALSLLNAGAELNDKESLYHSTEHPDLACLKLLLNHGASPVGTNSVKHMLDREDPVGLQLLLDHGADPDEKNPRGETALHWAVWRGRSAAIIKSLLEHGVDIDGRRSDQRTAYAMAVQSGQTEIAHLLEEYGADTELNDWDHLLRLSSSVSPQQLEGILATVPGIAAGPDEIRLFFDLAESGRTSAVRMLLAAGIPVDARGQTGETALHWACWKGYGDLAGVLLDAGAPLTIPDSQYQATPAGWFTHGLQNCGGGGDYVLVARSLLTHGATLSSSEIPTGNKDVDAVLKEYGLIE